MLGRRSNRQHHHILRVTPRFLSRWWGGRSVTSATHGAPCNTAVKTRSQTALMRTLGSQHRSGSTRLRCDIEMCRIAKRNIIVGRRAGYYISAVLSCGKVAAEVDRPDQPLQCLRKISDDRSQAVWQPRAPSLEPMAVTATWGSLGAAHLRPPPSRLPFDLDIDPELEELSIFVQSLGPLGTRRVYTGQISIKAQK